MDEIAEGYVRLALAVGVHDDMYVDAYYGPAHWREEARTAAQPLVDIAMQAQSLVDRLSAMGTATMAPMDRRRHGFLTKQLRSMVARCAMLQGVRYTFDEESSQLFDVVSPVFDEAHFERLHAALDELLPGSGDVRKRYDDHRRQFSVPPERLPAAMDAAMAECRARTATRIALPEGESARIGYVRDKTWGGYNWYEGNLHSLIEINIDIPLPASSVMILACHEGYPGHHVYNTLLEHHLVRGRGWVEFCVYPLFSPQSLIAEGTANFGIPLTFPSAERTAFEREVLFPLAGFDGAQAARYLRIEDIYFRCIHTSTTEGARRYLDGHLDDAGLMAWFMRYGLMDERRAAPTLAGTQALRSYWVTYHVGEEMIADHVNEFSGTEARWNAFTDLLTTPVYPSLLGQHSGSG